MSQQKKDIIVNCQRGEKRDTEYQERWLKITITTKLLNLASQRKTTWKVDEDVQENFFLKVINVDLHWMDLIAGFNITSFVENSLPIWIKIKWLAMFFANIVRYTIIDPFIVDVNFKINAFNYYKFLNPNSLEWYSQQALS